MTTHMRHVSFQHSHTIGRAEVFGAGFLNPVAVARGEGDLMYVLNRAYEHYPEGMRVTICTVGEDLARIHRRRPMDGVRAAEGGG